MRIIGLRAAALTGLAALLVALPAEGGVALAQVQAVDPDQAIDGDLSQAPPASSVPAASSAGGPDRASPEPAGAAVPDPSGSPTESPTEAKASAAAAGNGATYHEDDLVGAAEGVFGKGAKGIAGVIQGILRKQGEPVGYIVGREGGGAFVAGLRYGSGTLYHKVEGQRPVYWTGPSIGFDAGANVGSAFVLVYNLDDSEDLYKRFVAGEGQAYFIGGFNVSYLRHGSIVLIPVRLGAGLRLGANVGYMKFSHKQTWLPF